MLVDYTGQTVLITGATGFVGKALLERILFRFRPKRVYLLLRGVATERWEQVKTSAIWSRTQNFTSVVPISADLALDGLGLSDVDKTMLIEHPPHIVFHCAASVEFDLPLHDSITINVHGTLQLYDLMVEVAPCARFVHVSTAYIGCQVEMPSTRLSDTDIDIGVSSGLMTSDWPNTYTWSKAMCEVLLLRRTQLPLIIVRPSIITNANSEPVPGWGDSKDALIAVLLAHGCGIVRLTSTPVDLVIDAIPIDYVVNLLLTAGQHGTGIYHSTTSDCNPIRLRTVLAISQKHFRLHPPKKQVCKPMTIYVTNKRAYEWLSSLQHKVPVQWLPSKWAKIREISLKINDSFHHFSNNSYRFKVRRAQELEMDPRFPVVCRLNMHEYMHVVCYGISRYVLHEKIGDYCLCMKTLQDALLHAKL